MRLGIPMSVHQYKLKDGRVLYRVSFDTPNGKRTTKRGFKRRRDAVLWEAEHVIQAKAEGTFVDTNNLNLTVAQLYEPWLVVRK